MPRPRIAMVLGDPSGVGPELVARLLAEDEVRSRADVLLVGDRDEFRRGMQVAGCSFPFAETHRPGETEPTPGMPSLFHFRGSVREPFTRATATANAGRYTLETLEVALDLARRGDADALCFAPLNKSALHAAGMGERDELHWIARILGCAGTVCELNVLDGIWSSRVTSHVALKDVAPLITQESVLETIRLVDAALKRAGSPRQRIGVCGLNPHNGENGAFGREEIEVIAPAVERARADGFDVDGPYPADTIFLRVFHERRDYDAVVTMYHDQGQIALKLMGFNRGVTVLGGLPFPIATPAHGTAFDIVGTGQANPQPMRNAFDLACRMGAARRAAKSRDAAAEITA